MKLFLGKDLDEISRMAAGALATTLRQSRGNQPFSIALSGGSTPQKMHRLLTEEPYRSILPWQRLHWFFGDDRCVPPENKDSNFKAAKESLFSKAPIPVENIHRIPGEMEPAEAARDYETELARYFGRTQPIFDWVYLGIGDDGHCASLFPGSAALSEKTRWAIENKVDNAIPWRVTLTYPVLNQAKTVCFVVSGEGKAPAVKDIIEGDKKPRPPAAGIEPRSGDLRWFLDQSAASQLKKTRSLKA